MPHKNDMKFTFQCPWLKFYWNMVTPKTLTISLSGPLTDVCRLLPSSPGSHHNYPHCAASAAVFDLPSLVVSPLPVDQRVLRSDQGTPARRGLQGRDLCPVSPALHPTPAPIRTRLKSGFARSPPPAHTRPWGQSSVGASSCAKERGSFLLENLRK